MPVWRCHTCSWQWTNQVWPFVVPISTTSLKSNQLYYSEMCVCCTSPKICNNIFGLLHLCFAYVLLQYVHDKYTSVKETKHCPAVELRCKSSLKLVCQHSLNVWSTHPTICVIVVLRQQIKSSKLFHNPGGTWTHNRQLWRLMPFPLGCSMILFRFRTV